MHALILAVWAALGVVPPPAAAPRLVVPIRSSLRIEIPLRAPAGWKVEEQDRATILTPGDVPEGELYRVMVTLTTTTRKLDELLEDGRKMVAEIGAFQPKGDAARATSDGGWDHKGVLGTVATRDRTLMAYVVAIQKGDQGGVVVVLSDGVETMARYADVLGGMLRGMGVAKTPTSPAVPDAAPPGYRAPAAWVETKLAGLPYLVKEKNEAWVKYRLTLLVLPGEAFAGSVRAQFEALWRAYVSPNFVTRIAPIPLTHRLRSGYACAFDADTQAKDKGGRDVTVALYMLAHGGRVAPVLGVFSGPDWTLDRQAEVEIGELLETIRIPGTTAEPVKLFTAAALVGEWSESSSEFANYVTTGGAYAGDATITTGTYLSLRADGSYTRTLVALTGGRSVREKDAGTFTVEDDRLVLSAAGRYSLLGYATDEKVGRFLVLGSYPNQKTRLKLHEPAGHPAGALDEGEVGRRQAPARGRYPRRGDGFARRSLAA